jgi:hypothetical protein
MRRIIYLAKAVFSFPELLFLKIGHFFEDFSTLPPAQCLPRYGKAPIGESNKFIFAGQPARS